VVNRFEKYSSLTLARRPRGSAAIAWSPKRWPAGIRTRNRSNRQCWVEPYASEVMPDTDPGEPRPVDPIDAVQPKRCCCRRSLRDASELTSKRLGSTHIAVVMQNCRSALEALASKHAYLGANSD
jgi:hypothetical protein